METDQQPSSKPRHYGHWALIGAVLGAFIGLLVDKFALGLIFGFFVGAIVSSIKRKAAASGGER